MPRLRSFYRGRPHCDGGLMTRMGMYGHFLGSTRNLQQHDHRQWPALLNVDSCTPEDAQNQHVGLLIDVQQARPTTVGQAGPPPLGRFGRCAAA